MTPETIIDDILRREGGYVAALLSAFVIGLFSRSSPSAIGRLIRSVYIDSVNCLAVRPFPHIGEEIFEAGGPSLADRNTSSAVALIALVFRISAALLHRLPRPICRAPRERVRAVKTANRFFSHAATTARISGRKLVSCGDRFTTTVAFADPLYALAARCWACPKVSFEHDQSPVSMTCSVYEFAHDT